MVSAEQQQQQQQDPASLRPRVARLGGSAIEVPIVCLGTMTMGEQNDQEVRRRYVPA